MDDQNKEIAVVCFQNILDCADIVSDNEDNKIAIRIIETTIKRIRQKQHEATKGKVMETYNEWNGLDEEVLENIDIPNIDFYK
jgi:hypothetical protein